MSRKVSIDLGERGKLSPYNNLNDLTGKEWLKLTGSFWMSEKCANDKDAMKQPAPFLIKDIQKLISMFTKKEMRVLDPFCGSGTTLIASCNIDRFGIGIDLNAEYKELALNRLKQYKNFEYIVRDGIPGIKKGDKDGKMLRDLFLNHISKTKILLFIIYIDLIDPLNYYQVLKKYLHLYVP